MATNYPSSFDSWTDPTSTTTMNDASFYHDVMHDGVLIATRTVVRPVRDVNAETLHERALAALTANATYLAIATPTQAQAVAQVEKLTREVNALIRMMLNEFDTITDA